MSQKNQNLMVLHCLDAQVDNHGILHELIEKTYTMLGGNHNSKPYLVAMKNHAVDRDFVAGGVVSDQLSVFLDYKPFQKYIQLKIISEGKIRIEEVAKQMENKFGKCTIEQNQ